MEYFSIDIDTNQTFPGRTHYYYADGIGDIRCDISFLSGDKYYEKRLVSYEIK